MANPAWFDEYTYLNSKLNQLTSAGVTGYTTITQVKAAIEAAGMTTYQHFSSYSLSERTSPNEYFNTNEYLAAKAVQLGGTYTAEKVALALQNAGYTNAYAHFTQYGWAENVNPSNAFDVSAYFDLKATETGKTVDEVKAAFAAAGLDPISHYMTYGMNETGISVTEVPAAEQVAADTTSGSAGQSFTLTSGIDTVSGTSGDDTIIGDNTTSGAADQITGGAGTDTLKLYGTVATVIPTTLSGVEVLENYSLAAALDVSGYSSITEAWQLTPVAGGITGTVNQTLGLGGAAGATAATMTFTNVTGSADTANIALNNAGSTTAYTSLTVAGIETLNIQATGTNKLGNLTIANATKLVTTGEGSLTAILTGTVTKTIDGSAATGKITIDNSAAAAAIESIKTGSADDAYTTNYANLTADDAIDMGAGTDSLNFADDATFNSTTTKALLTKVTNVEKLGVTTTAKTLTVDGDYVSQTSYLISGATAKMVLTNVANGAEVNFGKTDVVANATGVNTVAMKLGANTLNVNLQGAATGAAVVGGVVATVGDGLAVSGSATINVKSTGTDGQPNNVLDLTAADNQSVLVTGSQNLTLVAKAATGTTGFSIDGNAFTGKLTVTGTAAGDSIKGGTGVDTITGGDGTDTMTGGAGADTFAFAAGDNAGANGAAVADVITDFVVGTDKLQFTAFADVVSGQQAAVQAAVTALAANSTEAQIATAMANANTTDLGVSFAVFGGNTYAYAETTGATATHVEAANIFIKLTGVTTAPTFAADVVA